jgi:hypothetical protein
MEAAIVSMLAPFHDNSVGYLVAGGVAANQLRAGAGSRTLSTTSPRPDQGWMTVARGWRRPWQPITQDHLVVDSVGDPVRRTAAVIDWLAEAEH